MSYEGEWSSLIVAKDSVVPKFGKNNNSLEIKLNDVSYSAGKWMLKLKRDKDYPAISAKFKYEKNSEKESKFICALTQYDKDGNEICGDYLTEYDNLFSILLELSENTDYIIFEFLFYSFGNAELKIYPDTIEFVKSKPHRTVNVATTCFKRKFTNDCNDNLEEV